MYEQLVTIIGLNELTDSLKNLARHYPAIAGEVLREEGRALRKNIVNNAREMTETKRQSKQSLGKIGSYRVSQVMGFGENQYVEVYARSKHFHLVERGHAIVMPYSRKLKNGKKIKLKSGGTVKGRVEGKFFLKKAKDLEMIRYPQAMDAALDMALKKYGLT